MTRGERGGWGRLEALGFGRDFLEQLDERERAGGAMVVGRVVEAFRKSFLVHDGERVLDVAMRAALFHREVDKLARPVVGDWVVVKGGKIWRVLGRRGLVVRQAVERHEPQAIAANVDRILVVMAMGIGFDRNKLERYVALVHESQAEPVVVLTKGDLVEDEEPYLELARCVGGVGRVMSLCGLDEASCHEVLKPLCQPGETVALLGPSGVGKSTLVNALLGEARQVTGEVRERDGKGRHTTTTRQLLLVPNGGVVLDTPGMRELEVWRANERGLEALDEAFPQVSEVARGCHFRDCTHEHEPGCAVWEAVEAGELDVEQVSSWRAMRHSLMASRQERS